MNCSVDSKDKVLLYRSGDMVDLLSFCIGRHAVAYRRDNRGGVVRPGVEKQPSPVFLLARIGHISSRWGGGGWTGNKSREAGSRQHRKHSSAGHRQRFVLYATLTILDIKYILIRQMAAQIYTVNYTLYKNNQVSHTTSREALLGWRCARSHSHVPISEICVYKGGKTITGEHVTDTRTIRWEIIPALWAYASWNQFLVRKIYSSRCHCLRVISKGCCIKNKA